MAITHRPSPAMEAGERTFVGRAPIDPTNALAQHAAYCDALRDCGAEVTTLDANRAMPDCVFVEDTAIVLDELAVMMSMGAASRRAEPPVIEAALRPHREIAHVRLPATIDGGDVVRAGRMLYVGRSARTNAAAIAALAEIVRPYGYRVEGMEVRGCLHLKTACSALPDGRFLVQPEWVDTTPLPAQSLVPVPPSEPWAGDVLAIGDRIVVSDAFPETCRVLTRLGFGVVPVSVTEFAKAEGGVTCLSLVFRSRHRSVG